ncbi:MAG: formylmethanofuran--tetrahydromethanopterin N-formyltransferase [Candidatus Bathyarchaeota archaeon]|nr:formylmethanofuran--tetrahydromethanopterin N-formyltransferase [Candidatus Bathyarchaeota archaeon]MCX8177409.1 formylmethanofuran--tetrahydromethanopterin N-formyltransferase [Candidatus Bathyarchaeota archaeon]MDW8193856.1 formylmethanofuran--tetrahydromethanopterin N-formyltransferase [Nitrososphaerota archaeon]
MNEKLFVENTYAEAFQGVYCRVIVTADDEETLVRAAEDATATPATVIGRIEGGVEKLLGEGQTPDGRKGAVLQFWGMIDPKKPFSESLKRFEVEFSYRIRQDILVKPFTALFDASLNPEGKLDMMERVGYCGDGYEWTEERYGRTVIVVPIMVPDFIIERYLGYARGVMGANFWIMCETKEAVKEAGRKSLEAIHEIEGVVTPFDVCSAGSKPETRYPWIGPTTNHSYCPSLRKILGGDSKVPEGVRYIPEIVINGISLEAVKQAMRAGITAAMKVKGVVGISAGNYGGKLGDFRIHLQELFK